MPHNRPLATNTPAPASDATRLRVLAGTPHSRRGSVLVLVVGVLALLAIIIVVYTSVGQADVRGGRALVNQARLDDQSRAMSEHIRSIIGEDASAVRVQRVYTGPGAGTYYSTRETTDYPYTDPYYRSNVTLGGVNADYARFNPAGNITSGWTAGNEDPRVTSDSYLATTEPTWSNRNLNRLPPMPQPFGLMGRHRDWGHLSIISPSGLPVNLASLRGNFSAPSGFTGTAPYSQSVTPAMSDWLYLWDRASANAGFNTPPVATQVTAIDLYNSPATWSNDRLETFRPTTWNPSGLTIGDVKFMGNTLGDADGDGYYDALWQELVDASDPSRPNSLLQGGTGVRWFIAPRIVDLSSMVNLNTATSMAVPPDIENPAGITPSDVDLERLLTTADARQYFGVYPGADWVDGSNYSDPRSITEAGYAAFAGILEARATGLPEVGDNRFSDLAGPDIVTPQWLVNVGVQRPNGVTGNGVLLGSVTRRQLYTVGGKDEASGQLRVDNTGTYLKQNGGFGLGDERELRAFGAVNDARGIARIETVANADPRFAFVSPFRSLRDFVTDRDAGSLANSNVSQPGDTVPASFAQYFTDVRHLLTTTSGSRPIRYSHKLLASATDPAARFAMTEDDLRVDINPLIRNAVELNPDAAKGIYPLSAANEIFTNYALALSPFLGNPLVWNDATAAKRSLTLSFGGPTYKTATTGIDAGETDAPTFTGRAAEVALRTAAHLTINLLAWQDNSKANSANPQPDNRPLAATVLLDGSPASRSNVLSATISGPGGGNPRAFPYWPTALPGRLSTTSTLRSDILGNGKADFKSYAFDMDSGLPAAESRLAGFNGNNTLATGYAINIFAAQPQPFVTAAVSFDMYYDAPIASGGDSIASGSGDRDGEWILLRDAGGNPIGIQPLGITMRGEVQSTNKDFLLECVAFQVTNPFDVPITLGDTGAGSTFSYYFEFAGKYYDASKYNDAGVRIGAVTLAPRQSVCFYVLNDDPARIQANWQAADPTIATTAVQDWLNKQLTPLATGQALPLRTVEISPATGTPIAPNAFHDSFNSLATSDSNKVVKLWRAVRQPGAVETAANNDVANDYLVDRLHDPDYGTANRAALYRRLDPGNNRFTTIDAGPEPSEPESQYGPPMENVGYAITFYGAIRRRTDPSGGPLPGATSDTTAGVMPAWCMEPKSGPGFTAAANSKNVTEANPGITSTASVSGIGTTDFATGKDFSDRSFKRMVGKGITRAAYTTAGKHPASRDQGNDASNLIGSDLASLGWVAGGKATQLPIYPRRNGATLNTEVEKPPLRPADLLLPWAIGPYQNPTLPGATAEIQLELRHTTLSEAIAFGLNYSASTATDSYEFQIGKALDRGRLPTDRYIPFNDIDSNGEWTYGRGSADPSIVNGVPFALNILDRFRTTRYGTIDSAMPGLVNINTAPLNVLRMLPLLTPASAHLYGDDSLGLKGHWMNDASAAFALKLKDEAGATTTRSLWKQTDDRWDVAGVLAAYRDKQAVVVRGNQKDESGASRVYADFSPRNDGKAVGDLDYRGGRPFMTNCVNIRTEPGFKSVGEIMLALVQDDTVRAPGQSLDAVHQKQLGIDRLAAADNTLSPSNFQTPITQISNTNVATLGTLEGTGAAREQGFGLTAQAALRPATVGPGNHFVHGGKTSDYDRKIALADALLNTVSTRSDLFCAYFLVNGYTEGDVQGLEPWTGNGAAPAEDRYTRPMTPSIQRRYMMVLDRSQCTRPGDKPKVLMFEELPVK